MSWFVWPILLGLIVATLFLGPLRRVEDEGKVTSLRPFGFGGIIFAVVFAIAGSVATVPTGQIGVTSVFGILDLDNVAEEGTISFVAPWVVVNRVNIQTAHFDFSGDDHVESTTADDLRLELDVTVTMRANPVAVPTILAKLKGDWEDFVAPFVRSGIRDAVAKVNWEGAISRERGSLAEQIRTEIAAKLRDSLVQNGFSAELAVQAFIISPVQLRDVRPPERVRQSMNELAAANIRSQTMVALAAAAEQEALVRAQEGAGYFNLLSQLPEGVGATDAAALIGAIAEFRRTEALATLIEKAAQTPGGEQLNFNIILGGSGATPMIPTGAMTRQ